MSCISKRFSVFVWMDTEFVILRSMEQPLLQTINYCSEMTMILTLSEIYKHLKISLKQDIQGFKSSF